MIDVTFHNLTKDFLRVWATFNPQEAFEKGWRSYGGILDDISLPRLQAYRHFLHTKLSELQTIDRTKLTPKNQIDWLALETFLLSELFNIEEQHLYTQNPLTYAGAVFIFDYLLKSYAPLDQRIKELSLHLDQLPLYYSTAVTNLDWVKIPPELIEVTVEMVEGMVPFLGNLTSEVQSLETEDERIDPTTLEALEKARDRAVKAVEGYLEALKTNKPNAKGQYRLGAAVFSKMLQVEERVDLPLQDILHAGEESLAYYLEEISQAAQKVDPTKTVDEVAREIRQDHPTAEELIPKVKEILVTLRQFLLDTNFVTVPSQVMPDVIETPKPFRPFAFAAMDSPGPLDTKVTQAYYYITPPEPDWSEQEQIEWLETFNYRGLIDISAHEAFPGHFLHSLHNQRSWCLISKLFGAYHFWEGWALYVEEAMWQEGFQEGDYKYRIAQIFETLLRLVRLVVAIKIHTTEDFSLEEATQLFMKKAFLGRKPAENEAKRATYDPGYLNYALGKLMVEKLRRDCQLERGDTFSLQQFHDELLSYGAPPIPLLRQFMLQNEDLFDQVL